MENLTQLELDSKYVHQQLLKKKSELRKRVQEKFVALAFENRYTLHPRHMKEMGSEEVEQFLTFLDCGNRNFVTNHARRRVREGLGERTIMALGDQLRGFCWEEMGARDTHLLRPAVDAVDEYISLYVQGYVAELAKQVLQDQEQMRRALSAALQRQRRELHVKDHAMNTSINGVMLTDLEGLITYVNPAFLSMWGYDESDEVRGRDSAEFLATDAPQNDIGSLEGRLDQGWRGELRVQRKDGSFFEVEISASSIKDDAGHPIGIMASFMDITERKQLEAEIRQRQKMEAINTLAGGIAHDFNNLLTAIQGNASLMLLEADPSSRFYDRLRTIEKQVQSGSKLTSQLLGYARAGRYEVKPFNLNNLITDSSDTFNRTRKEITVNMDLENELFLVEADQGQIEQILLNLYINASDAMPSGGELTLKTMNVTQSDIRGKIYHPKIGNYVKLTVADTGTGMDKKTTERIFDPFFTTKQMGRGTGLGLASVYGIVKGHGGYIEVDSKKGHGTLFTIYLPATERVTGERVGQRERLLKGNETILLIDDEEMVLNVSVDLLRHLGYEVLFAGSGADGLKIYEDHRDRVALVILDMIMPGMGGGETYDRLKTANPGVKVLLASGYSIDGQATEIMKRGCNGFAQKPFDIRKLSRKIREIMDAN